MDAAAGIDQQNLALLNAFYLNLTFLAGAEIERRDVFETELLGHDGFACEKWSCCRCCSNKAG